MCCYARKRFRTLLEGSIALAQQQENTLDIMNGLAFSKVNYLSARIETEHNLVCTNNSLGIWQR